MILLIVWNWLFSVRGACEEGFYTFAGYCFGCLSGYYCDGTNAYACPAGTYSMPGAATCTNCNVGYYQSSQRGRQCYGCPPGSYSAIEGATECTLCSPGYYTDVPQSSICDACPSGKYSPNEGADSCFDCQAGFHQNQPGKTSCDVCLPGTYSEPGSLSCTDCGAGSYQNDSGKDLCIPCPSGTYSTALKATSDSVCIPCEPGYASEAGSSKCTPCPAGSYAESSGAGSCSLCPEGFYQSLEGQKCCQSCPEGSYSSSQNSTSCINCSPGFFQASSGQSSCEKCLEGTYSSSEGSTSCTNCSAGYHLAHQGGDSCDICTKGTYSSVSGSSKCDSCPPGFYQPLDGQSECLACEAGTFSSAQMAEACTACGLGKYQSSTGQASCDSCPAGTYSSSVGATSCIDCGPGYFSSSPGSAQCSICGQGSYSLNTTGSTSCGLCSPGYYQPLGGQKSCLACPKGTFSSSEGSASCTNCSGGYYQSLSAQSNCLDECLPGTFSSEQAISCTKCSPGYYQNQKAQSSCKPCAAGTYSSISSAVQCLDCTAGTYSASGSASCSFCPLGTYQSAIRSSECIECPAGTYMDQLGSTTSCLVCPAGSYSSKRASKCTACSAGHYQNRSGEDECIPCGLGTYQPNESEYSCIECPAGTHNNAIGATSLSDCVSCSIDYYNSFSGQADCLPCPEHSHNSSTFTECICDSGYYQNLTNSSLECLPCDDFCLECYGNDRNCSSCIKNEGIYQEDNQCFCNISKSYYDWINPNTSKRECKPCNEDCSLCYGPLVSECTDCISGLYLYGTTCMCPETTFFNREETDPALFCQDCGTWCARCINSSYCLSCINHPGIILNGSVCECDTSDNYFVFSSNTGMECLACHPLCDGCTGPNFDQCISCSSELSTQFSSPSTCECTSGLYYNSLSKSCLRYADVYKECDTSGVLQIEDQPFICVYDCLDISGYYYNGSMCAKCDVSCLSCNGKSFSECIRCKDPKKVQMNGICASYCEANYFASEGVCHQCHSTCANCTSASSFACTECSKGLLLHSGQCVLHCPDGTYEDSGVCLGCPLGCSVCTSSIACFACTSNYYLVQSLGRCVNSESCPSGTYPDEFNNSCNSCHLSCYTCFGSTPRDCISCNYNEGYVKYASSSTCHKLECSDGKFVYLGQGAAYCKNCDPSCQTCDGPENCLTCKSGFLAVNAQTKDHVSCVTCENFQTGYYTSFSGECKEVCGDGINLGQVECDDGNQVNGDGCSSQCKIEEGFSCAEDSQRKDICKSIVAPSVSLSVRKGNVLVLKFSKSVHSTVSSGGFSEFIDIKLVPAPKYGSFYYKHRNTISAGIFFTNLIYDTEMTFSLSGKKHEFVVTFSNSTKIYDSWGNTLRNREVKAKALKQSYILASEASALEKSGTAFKGAGSAMKLTVLGVLALNLASATAFWAFLNFLQIIVLLPYISCYFPANLKLFITEYLSMSNLNLPFDYLPDWLPSPKSLFNVFQTQTVPDKFKDVNLDSVSVIINISDDLASWALFLLLYLSLRFLISCLPKTYCQTLSRWKQDFEYNVVLRIFIEAFLPICFSALLNISVSSSGNTAQTFSLVFAVILFLTCGWFIVVSLRLVNNPIKELESESFKEKYSTILEGIRIVKSPFILSYTTFFLLRRITYAIILVMLVQHSTMQILCLIFLNAFPMLWYLVIVRPFDSFAGNFVNIYNEAVVLFILVLLLMFDLFELSETISRNLAWAIIVHICFSLLLTWAIMILDIYTEIRKYCLSKKQKKVLPKPTKKRGKKRFASEGKRM